jgi:hypothetical protein
MCARILKVLASSGVSAGGEDSRASSCVEEAVAAVPWWVDIAKPDQYMKSRGSTCLTRCLPLDERAAAAAAALVAWHQCHPKLLMVSLPCPMVFQTPPTLC